VRGGAIPVLAWGALLVVLLAIAAVWAPDPLRIGQFGFAALVVLGTGVVLALAGQHAIRRGPPAPSDAAEVQTVPLASAGAVGVGLSVATILFGLAWGRFLVYFGAALLIASAGRVAIELSAQRRSRRRQPEEERR